MNKIYLPDRVPSLMASNHFRFPFLLLFFVLKYTTTGAQVNAYARVTGINAAKTILDISNLNETYGRFGAGRQVIVLQMQDDVIGTNTGNNASFGTLGSIGQAGVYEVATILSENSSQITLTAPLRKNYNTGPSSRVQVVSFNQLGNPDFTTNEEITALPWDGNIGGVIAFQVNGALQLRHSITADGAGFRGGDASDDDNLDCNDNQYITGSEDYGEKGEGIYRINNNNAFEHGRARILTGGGGGAGFNGGGGGGGNYTAGGNGGPGWQCNDATGGLGGIALNSYMMTGNRLFMGGGGGGGQGNNNEQTEGGNGGGIIIVKANSITGSFLNFERISANGESSRGTRGSGNDGAGGAGAGGSIYLQVSNYNVPFLSHLLIQANGGDGGDVESFFQHGGGGGGAQGAVLLSGAMPTSNITINTLNGEGGLNSLFFGSSRAGNGSGVDNTGIVANVGALPVRLLYFAADAKDAKTRLNWTATDELNTLFHVQHSTDGTHFTTIGIVKGSGKGAAINNYSFIHHVPAPGNNYYRLEMTEEPDFISYSSIARVNFNDLPTIPVAYPNPATDHFSMRLTDINNNTNYAVRISDLSGKIVYTGSHRPVNNIITVHTGNKLVPGVYIVTVNTATRTHLVKLVIR